MGILESLIFKQKRAVGDAVSSWGMDGQTSRIAYNTILDKNRPDRQETSQKMDRKKIFFRQGKRSNCAPRRSILYFSSPYIIIGDKVDCL